MFLYSVSGDLHTFKLELYPILIGVTLWHQHSETKLILSWRSLGAGQFNLLFTKTNEKLILKVKPRFLQWTDSTFVMPASTRYFSYRNRLYL